MATTTKIKVQRKIRSLIKRNALFVVNHSGGKDSQAMYALIKKLVPANQIVVIHAVLPEVEWAGVIDHVQNTIDSEFIQCEAVKTFEDMVLHRGMWPSPKYRQCTSDLKRGPIEKAIRHYLKAHPEFGGLVVSCMGIRAEESPNRAKAVAFKLSKTNSKAGREWYDWLPIHSMLIGEVFETISNAGQKPHWAYSKGMSRLSCVFCIMGSKADTVRAAKLNPAMFAKFVAIEKHIDQTFVMPSKTYGRRFLEEVTGIKADPILVKGEKARLVIKTEAVAMAA